MTAGGRTVGDGTSSPSTAPVVRSLSAVPASSRTQPISTSTGCSNGPTTPRATTPNATSPSASTRPMPHCVTADTERAAPRRWRTPTPSDAAWS
ncbi:hypothetical protein NKH18_51015 [Streptomyces sp. M10(2022)]